MPNYHRSSQSLATSGRKRSSLASTTVRNDQQTRIREGAVLDIIAMLSTKGCDSAGATHPSGSIASTIRLQIVLQTTQPIQYATPHAWSYMRQAWHAWTTSPFSRIITLPWNTLVFVEVVIFGYIINLEVARRHTLHWDGPHADHFFLQIGKQCYSAVRSHCTQ